MKSVILGALAASLSASAAYAAEIQDFTLHNNTGKAITEVYVAQSGSPKWQDDLLGKGVLESGDAWDVKLGGFGDAACKFDVKIKTDDGSEWVVDAIDLCETTNLKLSLRGNRVVFERD